MTIDDRDTDPSELRPIPSEPPISVDPDVLRNTLGQLQGITAALANLESIPRRLEAVERSIQTLLESPSWATEVRNVGVSISTRFDRLEKAVETQQTICKAHHPGNGIGF